MENMAYWINPRGKVMEPAMYHIGSIISNPSKFGETKETIKDTFDKHNEPISKSSEGNARNEIMERVMKRGFIRIRKHNLRRMQKWIVELYDMSHRKAYHISDWARWMIKNNQTDDLYADVKITDLKDLRGAQKDLSTLAKIYTESKDGVYTTNLITLSQLHNGERDIEVIREDQISSWDDLYMKYLK